MNRVNHESHIGIHPPDDTLDDFVSGRLSSNRSEGVRKHIEFCVSCSEFVEDLDIFEDKAVLSTASKAIKTESTGPLKRFRDMTSRLFGSGMEVVATYSTSMWASDRINTAFAATSGVDLVANLDHYLGGCLELHIEPTLEATLKADFREPDVLFVCLLNLSRGSAVVRLQAQIDEPLEVIDVHAKESGCIVLMAEDVRLGKDELVLVVLDRVQ
jgi:hypothetical protein